MLTYGLWIDPYMISKHRWHYDLKILSSHDVAMAGLWIGCFSLKAEVKQSSNCMLDTFTQFVTLKA